MPVLIEKGRCIYCGICEALAPQIFKQREVVEVDQAEAEKFPHYTQLCIEACPMDCIKIE